MPRSSQQTSSIATTPSRPLPAPPGRPGAPGAPVPLARRRWFRATAALLLLLGVTGLAWALWPNPHLRKIKQLQKELSGEAGRNLSAEERRQKFQQLRAENAKLSPRDRAKLRARRREA